MLDFVVETKTVWENLKAVDKPIVLYGMSLLLYSGETKTIGVLLYELQTYADTQNASVLSVIILGIVLIGNLILNKVSKGNVGI